MDQKVLAAFIEYLKASEEAAREWQDKASDVWDMINGVVDWSHKDESMAKIHLNKVGMAYERIKSQFKKILMNFDEWASVEQEPGMESQFMLPEEAKRLVRLLTDNGEFRTQVSRAIGIGAVENRISVKVIPKLSEKKSETGISVDIVPLNIRNYYFDPFGSNLYEIHEVEMDKYQVLKLSAETPSKTKPYKLDAVKALTAYIDPNSTEKQMDSGVEQVQQKSSRRCNILLHEFYGTILDDDGSILEYEKSDGSKMLLENVMITFANRQTMISEPVKISELINHSPIVSTKLLHTTDNAYDKSLLYPGYTTNKALDELISMVTDGAARTMLNLVQVKRHLLEDPTQLDDGMQYNVPIFVNSQAGPQEAAIDAVPTGALPAPVFQVIGQLERDGAENMAMNEMNLSGSLPSKQIRATELVQSQGTFESLFDSLGMDIEDTFIEPLMTYIYQLGLTYASRLNDFDLLYIFGRDRADRAVQFKELAKKPTELFNELGYSFRFRGKGIKGLLRNTRVAQSLVQLLGTFGGIPPLFDVAERSLSFDKLFKILLRGYSIDPAEIAPSEQELALIQQRQAIREQALAQQQLAQGGQPGQQGNVNAPAPSNPGGFEPGNGAGQ